MAFRLDGELTERMLAGRDASDADRRTIARRADLARAWVAGCRDAKSGLIAWVARPAWRRIDG